MNNRRRMTGFVTSDKMDKTVVVEVTRSYRHRLYKKVVHSRRRFMVHDEIGCQLGDQVRIVESRPISKRKRWVVEEILRQATEGEGTIIDAEVDIVPDVVLESKEKETEDIVEIVPEEETEVETVVEAVVEAEDELEVEAETDSEEDQELLVEPSGELETNSTSLEDEEEES